MKKVGLRELKNRLAVYVKQVRRGATILVTDRGMPVARIVPEPETQQARPLEELLRELAAAGHLRLGTKPFAKIRPVQARGKPASQMIIEDRR